MSLLPMRDCFNRMLLGTSCIGCLNGSIFGCEKYEPKKKETEKLYYNWCKELELYLDVNLFIKRMYCNKCNFECKNKKRE